jgi:uncharacterized membrane protein
MKTDSRTRPAGATPAAAGERTTGSLQRPAPPRQSAANTHPETASIHQTLTPEQSAPASTAAAPPRIPVHKLSLGEINMAMVHFYRGEVQRANTWRNRLDTTTNWAVITAGATLSFAFSSPTNPHFVILINTILVAFFLFMEARRYRYYEIWSSRIRVIETGYFAQMLTPSAPVNDVWAQHLYDDLMTPHFTISEWEAVGRRLRRNYLWIFALLAASWNLKVYLHPLPAYDFDAFIDRARVGVVPGEVIFMLGILFNLVVAVFAILTLRLREATGEVLPQHDFQAFRRVSDWTREVVTTRQRRAATVRRAKRARERTRSPRSGQLSGEWKRTDTSERRTGEAQQATEQTLR